MNLSRLDPRVRIILLIGISTTALISRSPLALLVLISLTLLILLAGGVGPILIWAKLRGLFGVVAMLFVLQCLFNRSGEPTLTLYGWIIATDAGFHTAALVCLRLLIIILSALIVVAGETRDYLLALTQCKVPYEIAFMVLAALRFLPMLREEAKDVLCATQMRGLRVKKAGLRRQSAAYISIILPVISGAVRRAEKLSIAMEARGFRAYQKRTSMRSLRLKATDWIYTASFCTALAAVICLSYL